MPEFLENVRIARISRKIDKETELKYTDLRAEGAKVGVFQFTPTFAPKARSPPASTRPSSLSCVLDILCICTIYMYLLDVSIRDLKYFCVLFVLFVFLFMLLASLRCYTSIFDGFIPLLCSSSLVFGFLTYISLLRSWCYVISQCNVGLKLKNFEFFW